MNLDLPDNPSDEERRSPPILLRLFILLILGCSALGCGSSFAPAERLAVELLETDPPWRRIAPEGEEIGLDLETIDRMRELESARGGELVAVFDFPFGVHPYKVFAFVAREEGLFLQHTFVSWGTVVGKAQFAVSSQDLDDLLNLVDSRFECADAHNEQLDPSYFLVHWRSGARKICGPSFSSYLISGEAKYEDHMAVTGRIEKLIADSQVLREWSR